MDVHFNMCKVKYDNLSYLTNPIFKSQPIRSMNIFINLDDFFNRLKNPHVNQEFQACGTLAPKQLISNVYNLIAHYRQWGARKDVSTKVYAYYTTARGGFENRIYLPNYRKKFVEKCDLGNSELFYINNALIEADSTMKLISTYIDGVYIIDSRYVEPSYIPLFIQSEVRTADICLLITRDDYELQYCVANKFLYLYPRGEDSKIITSGAVWRHIANKEKIESPYIDSYSPELITLALAVVGDKRRSIDKVKRIGWRTLFNIIDDLSEKYKDFSFTTISQAFVERLENSPAAMEVLSKNLSVTSIVDGVKNMDSVMKEFITNQLTDVPDYENLNELNRNPQMFAACPLNLQFLTDEGGYKTKNPFI